MKNVADWIVLEIGFWQWRRINARRYGIEMTATKFDFLLDMLHRTSAERHLIESGSLVINAAKDDRVVNYLRKQLTPRRLALPDNYNLADRKRA